MVKCILYLVIEDEQEVDEVIGSVMVMVVILGKFGFVGGGNCLVWIILLQLVQEEIVFCVYFEGVCGFDDSELVVQVQGIGVILGVSLVWGVLVNVLFVDGCVEMQLEGDCLVNCGML